jgi:hypothetical protein
MRFIIGACGSLAASVQLVPGARYVTRAFIIGGMKVYQSASEMGKIGGSRKSKRKTLAVRANGKRGGRPRLYQPCNYKSNRHHRFVDGYCNCGQKRLTAA